MEDLNNVPSTGTFGNSINQVNQNFGLVKGAIENVEGRTIRSKGLFPTQAALTAAYPSPKVGDYAYVGSGLPATIYDCLVEGTWHNTGQTGGSETIDLGAYSTTAQMNTAIDNGLQGQVGYAVCNSNGLDRKDVVVNGFKLLASGGALHIKMTNVNTAANATMNISPTSTVVAANTKPLFYNGAQASAENTWSANEIISVYYDGTNYQATNSQGGGGKAEKIKYDNSQSGLSAENVQEAVDEMNESISAGMELSYEWGEGGVESSTGKPSGNQGNAISMAYRAHSNSRTKVGVSGSGYEFRIWEWDGATTTGDSHRTSLVDYQSKPYIIPSGKYYQITIRNQSETLQPSDSSHLTITPILESAEIEERVQTIEATRSKLLVHKIYTKNDCIITRIVAGNASENLTKGNRVKVYKWVPKGSVVTAQCTMGKGIAMGVYVNENAARLGSNNYIMQPNSASFTTDELSMTVLNEGWLGLTLCKSDSGVFTVQEHLEYINNLQLTIECDEWVTPQALFELPQGMKELYLGEMWQTTMTATELNPNVSNVLTRVVMSDVIAVPYVGVTIHCHLPYNIYLSYRTGDTADTLDIADNFIGDGEEFKLISPNRFYRIMFYRYNGSNITGSGQTGLYTLLKSEVDSMIANGDIVLYYKDNDSDDVITRNHQAEIQIKSFTHLMGDVVGDNHYIYNLDKYPIIAHTSDVHGDAYRLRNFYEFANMVNAKHCMVTGDTCCVSSYNNARFLNVIEDDYDIPTHFCIGNHDVKMITSNVDATLYSKFIEELAIKYNYVANGKPYYYYDDTTYKIRFISLNIYEEGNGAGSYWCSISYTQITWLISTLASTPADYGVLLMYHNPELHIVNSVNNKFMQSDLQSTRTYPLFGSSLQTGITANPITKIINAFILKENGSGSYVSGIHSGDSGDTVNYSYNFTSLTTQKFIAHVIGHTHCDAIGYYEGYDGSIEGNAKQVVLNAPNTNALYSVGSSGLLSNLIDIPRGDSGKAQDCFNMYIIDKDNELIHVVRVGSDMAYGQRIRDWMSISISQN